MLIICQQRFLFKVFFTVFIFFHKNRVFNGFYSWGQRVLHLWKNRLFSVRVVNPWNELDEKTVAVDMVDKFQREGCEFGY